MLRQRQCDSCENGSVRSYAGVVNVWIKVLELFVKKIARANGNETVSLRQPIADCRIDGPKVIATVSNRIPGK